MKFPRNSKLLRSPFDAAPFAAVFFLLIIFLLLGALLPTPGLPLQLPLASDLPGTDQPSVAMAVDQSNRFYYANQMMSFEVLSNSLQAATRRSRVPLTLVINADRTNTFDILIKLSLLARDTGFTNVLLATQPAATGQRVQLP
jgi:biopolymer transport protein ExbD